MSFEERNESWTGNRREFRQLHTRGSAPRVWAIQVDEDRIHTWWGQLGGLVQHAIEKKEGVNVGKKNEMTPAQYALDRAKDACRKKNWEGYREFLHDTALDEVVTTDIDFEALPLSLSFYKPDNSMGPGMLKKAEARKVWYARKRNGLMYVLARGEGSTKLYSRRMLRSHDDEASRGLTWDDRFPHIIEMANLVLPPKSVLLGELVMDRDGEDDFKHVQSITKSLTEQSIRDQQANGLPSFYCWDVAFWEGSELVRTWPVRARFELTHELNGGRVIQPVQFYDETVFSGPEEAKEFAKKHKWEGFVVVDPDGVYGDKAYNFKGKPDRPGTFCSKLKPEFEDDFVAVWDPDGKAMWAASFNGQPLGERSTKERNGLGIKSVALYQYDSKMNLVYISNVSSGLTDKMKKDLANPDMWPRVWRITYTDRTYRSLGDDTNALTFARFSEERINDKSLHECVNEQLDETQAVE